MAAYAALQTPKQHIPIINRNEHEVFFSSVLAERAWGKRSKSCASGGIKGDLRQHLYEAMQSFDVKQLIDFHQKNIKNNTYTMLILGNKNNLDYLSEWGEIEELSLEMLFGE